MEVKSWVVRLPALPYALVVALGITLASGYYTVSLLICGLLLCIIYPFSLWGRVILAGILLLLFTIHRQDLKVQQRGQHIIEQIRHTIVPISIPMAKVVEVDHRDFGTIATIEVTQSQTSLLGLHKKVPRGTRFNVILDNSITVGDRIQLEGTIGGYQSTHNFSQPDGYINPKRDGIAGKLQVRDWRILEEAPGRWISQMRNQIRELFLRNLLYGISEDSEARKILPAAVLGQRPSDRAWNELFRSSGAMHLFVVSGMHVGFIVLGFWVLMYFTPFSSRYILMMSLLVVWLYCWLTGGQPPIFRATLVYSFLSLGYLIRLRVHGLNSVLVAFLVIVVTDTYALFEVGVWLSFFVVIVLIIFAKAVTTLAVKPAIPDRYLPRELWSSFQLLRVFMAQWVIGLPAVSLVAWLASSVITYFVFGEVYLTGVLTTLLLLPAVFLMVLIGGVSILIGCISLTLSFPLNKVNEGLAVYSSTTVEDIHENGRFVLRKESGYYNEGLVVCDLSNGGAAIYLGDGAETLVDVSGKKGAASVLKPTLRSAGAGVETVIISHSDSQHEGGLEHFSYTNVIRAYEERPFDKMFGKWRVRSTPIHVPNSNRSDDNIALLRFTSESRTIGYISDAGLAVFKELERQQIPFSCDLLIVGENSYEENVISDFVHYTGAKTIVLSRTYSYQAQRKLKNVTTFDQRFVGALHIFEKGGGLEILPFLRQ